tara:strand:+ start:219 stop:335 length:117 start_codon:yes stop_codon:yes gene_type:complete
VGLLGFDDGCVWRSEFRQGIILRPHHKPQFIERLGVSI